MKKPRRNRAIDPTRLLQKNKTRAKKPYRYERIPARVQMF